MDLDGLLQGSEWIGVAASPLIGSFAAAASRRYALGERVATGRSRCDGCAATLHPWELVPLASWVALRGRCGHCGRAIGFRPLLVELAYLGVGAITLLAASGWLFWIGCLLGWLLLGLALIDLETFLLPDLITLPLIAAGLAVAALFGRDMVLDHAIAAGLGFLALLAVAWAYRKVTGRDGLGMGDVKLFAAAGAWVGLAALPSALLLATGAALAVTLTRWGLTGQGGRLDSLAFGPYLALAIWAGWLFGPVLPAG